MCQRFNLNGAGQQVLGCVDTACLLLVTKHQVGWVACANACTSACVDLVRFPNPLATDIHGSWGT